MGDFMWTVETVVDTHKVFSALLERLRHLKNTKKFTHQELADAIEVPVEEVDDLFGLNNLNGGKNITLRAAIGALLLLEKSPDIFDMNWYPQYTFVNKIAVRKFPNGVCLVDAEGPGIAHWTKANTKETVVRLMKKMKVKPDKVLSPERGLQWRDGKGSYLFLPTQRDRNNVELILVDLFGEDEGNQK